MGCSAALGGRPRWPTLSGLTRRCRTWVTGMRRASSHPGQILAHVESEKPLESEESERRGREETLARGKKLLSLWGFADKSRVLRRHGALRVSQDQEIQASYFPGTTAFAFNRRHIPGRGRCADTFAANYLDAERAVAVVSNSTLKEFALAIMAFLAWLMAVTILTSM